MSRLLKVHEHPGLARDPNSNGIINVDRQAYINHKRKKEVLKQIEQEEKNKEDRLNNLEHKLGHLENRIDQILQILTNGNSNSK